MLRVRAEMPGDQPSPRPDGWALGVLGISLITLGIAIMIPIEAVPPRYLFAQPTTDPLLEIIVCIGVMVLEAIAITIVLRARGSAPTAARMVAGAGVVVLLLLLFAPRVMHLVAPLVIAWLGLFGAVRIALAALWAIARRLTP